jgi:hypothetical protein
MALKSMRSRHSQTGEDSEIFFRGEDGTEASIRIRGTQWSNLISGILREMGVAQKAQLSSLKGLDRRAFWLASPPKVTSLRGAVSTEGVPVLTLELDGNSELDLSLEGISIPALIEWLSNLDEVQESAPGSSQPN